MSKYIQSLILFIICLVSINNAQTQKQLKDLDALVDNFKFGLPTGSIGYQESLLLRAARLEYLKNNLVKMRSPNEEFVNYWAKRMMIPYPLKRSLTFAKKAAELQSAIDLYKEMSITVNQIRHHADIEDAEKIELIKKAAVSNLFRNVKRIIWSILNEIGYLHPSFNSYWKPVYEIFTLDLEYNSNKASSKRDQEYKTLNEMRDAMWNAMNLNTLNAYHKNLNRLRVERDSNLRRFFSSSQKPYLSKKIIERDDLLNAYLNSTITYDEEVIRLFRSLKGNKELGVAVNAIYSLRESVRRQKYLLLSVIGRRYFTMKMLLEMTEMCIASNSYERSNDAIYQALRCLLMAEYLDPTNKDISKLLSKLNGKLKELNPLLLKSDEYVRMGYKYALEGDYQKALETFEKGLQDYPYGKNLNDWHFVVSYILSELKKEKSAYNEINAITNFIKINKIIGVLKYFAERYEERKIFYSSFKHYLLLFNALHKFSSSFDYTWLIKEQKNIRDKLFTIYKKLPLKPLFPKLAGRYVIEAERHLKNGEGYLAYEKYDKVLEAAPWWTEGYYNKALIYNTMGWLLKAIKEIKIYLILEPYGVYSVNANRNLQDWNMRLKEKLRKGYRIIKEAQFLLPPITQDKELQ
ncbi:MAG: hypothetical protein IIC75_01275 [Bacteroidetes bacterium]|nr:hypothetical protein [Bacteroidota bacterium]